MGDWSSLHQNKFEGDWSSLYQNKFVGSRCSLNQNKILGQGHFGMNIELLIQLCYAFRLNLRILYFFVLFSCLVIFVTIFLSQYTLVYCYVGLKRSVTLTM